MSELKVVCPHCGSENVYCEDIIDNNVYHETNRYTEVCVFICEDCEEDFVKGLTYEIKLTEIK